MDILEQALSWEKESMSNMTTSDRVAASRKAKALILGVNEIYKENKDPELMDLMKRLTVKKKKIDRRLNAVKVDSEN